MCRGFGMLRLAHKVMHIVEAEKIDEKQSRNAQRVENGVTVYQIIQNVVGGAVALHQEHIVVVDEHVGNVCHNAEAQKDDSGGENGLSFQPCHTGDHDVKGSKTGNGVGDAGHHVIKGKDRIRIVILTCAIDTQHCAGDAENTDKVQGGFLDHAPGEGSQRDCQQLDAAQKQRQVVKPGAPALLPVAKHTDLEQLKSVDKDGGPDQDPVLYFGVQWFVSLAKQYCAEDHSGHQGCGKQQMLTG